MLAIEDCAVRVSISTRWIPFEIRMPPKGRLLLVTNLVTARNAFGYQASHIWLTAKVDRQQDGEITCYDDRLDQPLQIRNLTHWRFALPEEGA